MAAQSAVLLEALERSVLRNSLHPLPVVSTTASCAEIEAVLGSELLLPLESMQHGGELLFSPVR
jgi:hypothetical protein